LDAAAGAAAGVDEELELESEDLLSAGFDEGEEAGVVEGEVDEERLSVR
jgi:hypothetical protein